jgi:hypothetical protein
MTGVILRCPHCGTSRSTPGECQACHEADVRFYCTNHTPGRWIDAERCPDCGARFGDPPPAPTPPPSRPRVPPERRAERPAAPVRPTAPVPPRPTPPTSPPRPTTFPPRRGSFPGPWGRPRARPAEPRPEPARWPPFSIPPSRRRPPLDDDEAFRPVVVPMGLAMGGCMVRMLILLFMAVLTFVIFAMLVGGSLVPILLDVY